MSGCFSGACRCCECQGKHCLVGHPGHSHRQVAWDRLHAALTAKTPGTLAILVGGDPLTARERAAIRRNAEVVLRG